MKLKIAQIAPIVERVPPKKYGGTERVIHALTEELVRRGHEVTLFASGNSETSARLVSVYPQSLREAGVVDPYGKEEQTMHNIGLAYAEAKAFDIIPRSLDAHKPAHREGGIQAEHAYLEDVLAKEV